MAHHPLAGVVEKLRNSDYHLRRLEAAVRRYMDSGSGRIRADRDPDDPARGRFVLDVRSEPSLEIAAIAGDVVHNLRSSLDYLVEELVKANGSTPAETHQFPICDTADGFAKNLSRGRLRGASDRAIRFVDGFQPYKMKPGTIQNYPLRHLRILSNRDKHHMLTLAAVNCGFAWKFVTADGRIVRSEQTTEPIRNGGVLAELPTEFVIDGEKVQFQSKLTLSVGFDNAPAPKLDIAATLQQIRDYVGVYMLPIFGVLFDPLPDELRLTSHGLADPSKPETRMLPDLPPKPWRKQP